MSIVNSPKSWSSKPRAGVGVRWGSPVSQGLIGSWMCNEGGGLTAFDGARYGNGALSGSTGVPAWSQAEKGYQLSFASANTQYVQVPHNASISLGNSFSIEISFLLNALRNFNGLIVKGASSLASPFDCYVNASGDLSFFIGDGSTSTSTVYYGNIYATVWYDAVLTYDAAANRSTIYVDGLSVATGSATSHGDTAYPLLFGKRADNATVLDGRIGYVRLWDRALQAAEVRALFRDPNMHLQPQRKLYATVPAASVASSVQRRTGGYLGTRIGARRNS